MQKESFGKPTYNLDELKRLIGNAKTSDITRSSLRDAETIGYSATEIIDAVLSLKQNEFYKTMSANLMPGLWQDVYMPVRRDVKLYVKL